MCVGVPVAACGESLLLGFAGNVEKGPSVTDLSLGGRPRSFPEEVLELVHALDTTGPCLFRARDLSPAGFADFGSSNEGLAE